MNLYDIMGPVMVGPSSSHTAGAVRIGLISRKLLGEKVQKAEILFHGSFFCHRYRTRHRPGSHRGTFGNGTG